MSRNTVDRLNERIKDCDKWTEGATKRLLSDAAERITYLQCLVTKKRAEIAALKEGE